MPTVSLTHGAIMRRLACILTFLVIAAAIDPAASAFKRLQRVVYIGTYTGETSKGIYAFRFDDSTGQLTPIGLVAETPSPSFLTASATAGSCSPSTSCRPTRTRRAAASRRLPSIERRRSSPS